MSRLSVFERLGGIVGGHMLLTTGVVFLIAWLVAVFGLHWAGDWTHMLLLAGLLLWFLGGLKARDAAMGRDRFRI